MFKQNKIYSLKERFITDVKRSPSWGYYFILIIWFIIITMILSATPSKAVSEPMELWEDYTYDISQLHFGDILKAQIYSLDNKWTIRKTFFTSYNPEVRQTDSSPCIGANGTNVCEMAKRGIRTIALSQDMVGRAEWKEYHYGDRVELNSDNPQCNGIFQIEDTMNKRYKNRGDIFCPTRACNTSCYATIMKLIN